MSTPVPAVFKTLSLQRYFMWCLAMREHYHKTGHRFSPTPGFFEKPAANEAFMYVSYYYAGLYVVCEGWQELKLSDPEIDALLTSPHLNVLKRFRHGVYHFQADYFDRRFMNAFVLGEDFDKWVDALTVVFGRFLNAWAESQTAAFPSAQPQSEDA